MLVTIEIDPARRTAAFREVSYLAAGDSCRVVLDGVRGADFGTLKLMLYRDAASESPVASCASFSPVPSHPSLAEGELALDTFEVAAWFADAVSEESDSVSSVSGRAGEPRLAARASLAERSVRADGWLVVADSGRTWAACRAPVLLRPGAGTTGAPDPTSVGALVTELVEGLVSAALAEFRARAEASVAAAEEYAAAAAGSASLATSASIAKIRERGDNGLWHHVVLTRNGENGGGEWVVDVDQDAGEGGGAFDAETRADGTAAARRLGERFADVLNVMDFGAAGDGETDDSAAIQAAVDAAEAGDRVVFPNGTYRVRGTVVVKTSGVTIDGGGALVLKDTTGPVFSVEGRMVNSSATNVSADANGHASSIEVEDAGGFSPGDWIYVKSLRSAFDPRACGNDWVLGFPTAGSPQMYFAEPARVGSVDGDVIYLTKPLDFPFYPAEREAGVDDAGTSGEHSTVRRIEFVEGVVIKNFRHETGTVERDSDNAYPRVRYNEDGYVFARLVLCNGVTVDGIRSKRRAVFNDNAPTATRPLMAVGNTVYAVNCLMCVFRDIEICHEAATGLTGSGAAYSAFHIASSWNCVVDSCRDVCGHDMVDVTYVVAYPLLYGEADLPDGDRSYPVDSGDLGLRGPSMFIEIRDCESVASASDAFVDHAGMFCVKIDRCRVFGAFKSGCDLRSVRGVVSGCLFDGRDVTVSPVEVEESASGKTTVEPLRKETQDVKVVQRGVYFRSFQSFTSTTSNGRTVYSSDNNETPFYRGSSVFGCRFIGFEECVRVELADPKRSAFENLDLDLRSNDFVGGKVGINFVRRANGDYSDWASRADGSLAEGDRGVSYSGVQIHGNRFYDVRVVLQGGYCRGLSFVWNLMRRCCSHVGAGANGHVYAISPVASRTAEQVKKSTRDVVISYNEFIDSGSPTDLIDTGVSYDILWMFPEETRTRYRGNRRVGAGYGYACNNMAAYTAENDVEAGMLTRLAALEAAVFPSQS